MVRFAMRDGEKGRKKRREDVGQPTETNRGKVGRSAAAKRKREATI